MSQLNEYIKWTSTFETESTGELVSHVGVLTEETDEEVTFLTKYGEMTIPKNDGYFSSSDREEFLNVVVPEKEVKVHSTEVVVRPNSKSEKALLIFTEMTAEGFSRKQIITKFKEQLDMSDAGGSTYYQNIKKKLGL
jgi:hypothetical protein